ncbi:hypothetical protein SASPL_114968 [Salvia splendens]|uniref:TF-B3 domain-containing protein n=1 Tax=Salvia splendens TaxID=180675 RepID=A0A8X8Y6M7_SALSN|nr:hypothetical protein SASPL_114968 [Salvia splendens]
MADEDPFGAYHRLPSFIKVFSMSRNKAELRLPPQWVAEHGDDLPFDYRLLSFTLVDVRIFHVKRYKSGTGCPPLGNLERESLMKMNLLLKFSLKKSRVFSPLTHICILALTEEEEDEEIYNPDIDSSDDYAPSDGESELADDSDYDDDRGALADDEYPTWTLKLTKSNIKQTIEIPTDFWQLLVRAAPQHDVVHFLVDGQTWRLFLKHSSGKIWIKHGWRRFKDANALFPGVRCHFKLVDAQDIQFYVWFDRP